MRSFRISGSLAMTVYTPEVYPVRIRGKGAAIAMGWGRFGGMMSPLRCGLADRQRQPDLGLGDDRGVAVPPSGLTLVLAYETRGNLEAVSRAA